MGRVRRTAFSELPPDADEVRLTAADGVPISAVHVAARDRSLDLALVVVHGFTGAWQEERVWRVADRLRSFGGVVAVDQRGHGRSGGQSSVGDTEVFDVAAAVAWARELGYARVVTVGFSLGGAVVVREAALLADGPGRVDAVVAVSAPAFWYYRGTKVTRLVHHLVLTRHGRLLLRARGTRVSGAGWTAPEPVPPAQAAARLAVPILVVHGDVDRYFPTEHAQALHAAARSAGVRSDLWIEEGFGHAEGAATPELVDRIGRWVRECVLPADGSQPT